MKKSFIYFAVILICSIFLGASDIRAISDTAQGEANNNAAVLVCEYVDSSGEVQGRIYYRFLDKTSSYPIGPWYAFYRRYNSLILLHDKTFGPFYDVFGDGNSDVYFQSRTSEADFRCPKNFFIGYNGISRNKMCYKDGPSCGNDFDAGPFSLSNNGSENDTIFHIIDEYADDFVTSKANATTLRNSSNMGETVRDNIRTYIKNKYSFDTKYNFPPFIENYISRLNFTDHQFNVAKDNIIEVIDRDEAAGNLTHEQAVSQKQAIRSMTVNTALNPPVSTPSTEVSDELSCEGLLGEAMSNIIISLFSFIKYLGPVLVAVLSTVDFAKAAISGDEGETKKAYQKLIKRAICAVLLFFVPMICKTIFEAVGIIAPDVCIK